jgi:transcription elongation factor S-II
LELLNKLEQLEPPSEADLRVGRTSASSTVSCSNTPRQTSKAGATINKLQKNASTPIAALAKQIVTKWKHAVDAQKKRKREANGDASGEGNAEKKVKGEPGAKIKAENVASAGKHRPR